MDRVRALVLGWTARFVATLSTPGLLVATLFEQRALYREPEWMSDPRGPDVSQELRWYPVVTMLQLAVDMMAADRSPLGYGHAYAPEHYVHAWRAVTDPPGWSESEIEGLKRRLRERAEARIEAGQRGAGTQSVASVRSVSPTSSSSPIRRSSSLRSGSSRLSSIARRYAARASSVLPALRASSARATCAG